MSLPPTDLFTNPSKLAVISEDGRYRYQLQRKWDEGDTVAWLMLNPSTADAEVDDATIRKCVGFSKLWGYGSLVVVNLFALRSRNPMQLSLSSFDPVGPLNDDYIRQSLNGARELICAWGCFQHLTTYALKNRPRVVIEQSIPASTVVSCLGYRKDGQPRHPLMLAYSTPREAYVRR